jgi:LPXTG-motif cell wall-anchored protein
MNSSFGIIQSVLCSSPVQPPAPGCVYGLPSEYGIPAGPGFTEKLMEQATNRVSASGLYALGPVLSKLPPRGGNVLTPEEFVDQKKKEEQKKEQNDYTWVVVGGSAAAILIGLGAFLYIRRRKA